MDSRIAWAVRFMNENMERDINLKKISESLNLSYGYCSELFKKETGKPFSRYRKENRIQKAQLLLRTSSKEIKDIAFSLVTSPWPIFIMISRG